MESLDQMVVICLIFLRTTILFFIVDAPFYIFISNALGFQLLHILAKTFFLIIDIVMGFKWYHIVVLSCISLMINDAEHLNHVLSGHLCVFFGKMSVQNVFAHF